MNWYRARFILKSWLASEWQSDTIFGHLCWALKYTQGEEHLLAFLASCAEGSPPLLVSNGFPGDLLPRPVLPARQPVRREGLAKQREDFRVSKDAKGAAYLTPQEFTRALRGEVFVSGPQTETARRRSVLKSQISRLTGTTGQGGQLYEFEEYRQSDVSVYLKIEDGFVEQARCLLQYVADTGYGKRKSVGYGQIESFSLEPFAGFDSPPDADGFVTLSNFMPSKKDPVIGAWQPFVKYGKLGEEYAAGDNPFKRPLLMLRAGATFYDSPCRAYYGRLVHGVSAARPHAVQYAFALPVPIKLQMNRANDGQN